MYEKYGKQCFKFLAARPYYLVFKSLEVGELVQ